MVRSITLPLTERSGSSDEVGYRDRDRDRGSERWGGADTGPVREPRSLHYGRDEVTRTRAVADRRLYPAADRHRLAYPACEHGTDEHHLTALTDREAAGPSAARQPLTASVDEFRNLARAIERLRRGRNLAAVPERASVAGHERADEPAHAVAAAAHATWLDDVRLTMRARSQTAPAIRPVSEALATEGFASLSRDIAETARKSDLRRLESMLAELIDRLAALEEAALTPRPALTLAQFRTARDAGRQSDAVAATAVPRPAGREPAHAIIRDPGGTDAASPNSTRSRPATERSAWARVTSPASPAAQVSRAAGTTAERPYASLVGEPGSRSGRPPAAITPTARTGADNAVCAPSPPVPDAGRGFQPGADGTRPAIGTVQRSALLVRPLDDAVAPSRLALLLPDEMTPFQGALSMRAVGPVRPLALAAPASHSPSGSRSTSLTERNALALADALDAVSDAPRPARGTDGREKPLRPSATEQDRANSPPRRLWG